MNPDRRTLRTLLTADEDSEEYRRAAIAVEQSPELLQSVKELELQEQAGEWWRDVRAGLLEEPLPHPASKGAISPVTVEVNPEADEDHSGREGDEPISLDFLGPAVHSELLGRLDRYDIECVIGVGGTGIVLRACDSELHRVVAIKVLAPHLAHHSSARRRFAREAQAAAAVVHPHVIPIHNVASAGKFPYLVMQYVAGESLQQRVHRNGPLTIAETLRIAQQTAAGLAAAHRQGLVHRDVKPANILLEDHVERVLLSDFGLARTADDASLTRTGFVAGTPWYMSPEQAFGAQVDHRSDLFSLGCVICFMLTGQSPFPAPNAMAALNRVCHEPPVPVQDFRSDVPAELIQLIDRLLSKNPAMRPATAQELEHKLSRLLSACQQGRLKPSPARRMASFRRRTARYLKERPAVRRLLTAILASLVCLSSLMAGMLIRTQLLPSPPDEWPSPRPAAPASISAVTGSDAGVARASFSPTSGPDELARPATAQSSTISLSELRENLRRCQQLFHEDRRYHAELPELERELQSLAETPAVSVVRGQVDDPFHRDVEQLSAMMAEMLQGRSHRQSDPKAPSEELESD